MSSALVEPTQACREAERRLQEYVDRQLTDDEIDRIEQHLAVCERCTNCYRFETEVRLYVREACVTEPCPETLKLRLRSLCVGCDTDA
jgi:anti-sigma factor (TIGR02949 family)